MKVTSNIKDIREICKNIRQDGKTIAFIPTMGYLHDGHLSLIQTARERADFVVVSIFVNPTQFAPGEDLDKYPREPKRDEKLCSKNGVDLLFTPNTQEMYNANHKTFVITNNLSQKLCGESRPTHFSGVTTIVCKMFNIIQPDFALFGQKDAQQSLIIKRMVQDLNFDVQIVVVPTVREKDGLALSSRNKYLSAAERKEAASLNKALMLAKEKYEQGEKRADVLLKAMTDLIKKNKNAEIDYIKIVDQETLDPVDSVETDNLIALAVKIGNTRLIDNLIIEN